MDKIDFSKDTVNGFKAFNGSNGSKISVYHNEKLYMLKFSPKPKNNKEMDYTNSCISEYIGCHIFDVIGIETQNTVLGSYKGKLIVGCEDFTSDGSMLLDFKSICNTVYDSSSKQNGTELSDVLTGIKEQSFLDDKMVLKRFWDMFVCDALLGNFDRHNGNWGFLTNQNKKTVKLAPVYDCGSCLYPQADSELKKEIMKKEKELEERLYVFPQSALKICDKKINYFQFLSTTDNQDCLLSLRRILRNYDEKKINEIIDNTPGINLEDKSFYKFMVNERKEKILDYSLVHNKNNQIQLDEISKEVLEFVREKMESKELINKTFEINNQKYLIKDIIKESGQNRADAIIEDCETHNLFQEKNFAGSNPFKLNLNQKVDTHKFVSTKSRIQDNE